MIKSLRYIFLFTGLAMLTQACNKDYLDKYPLSGPSDQSYFTNQDELVLAVNGLYKGINYAPLDGLPITMLLDNCTDIGFERNVSDLQKLGEGNQDANNSFTKGIWTKAYQVIARCNFVLDNVEKVKDKADPAIYNRSIAEARFVRAYVYQHLIAEFGDVPLVTHQLNLSNSQLPRTSKDEVLSFIFTELDSAALVLPATYSASDVGRATRGAALAIKARAALYSGKWDVAAEAAKAVMDEGVYSLEDDYARLFTYDGQSSKEIIFAFQYQLPAINWGGPYPLLCRNAGGASNKVPSQSLVDAYECTDGQTIDKSARYDPEHPYEHRDPRLGATIALPGSTFFNYQFETNKDSVKCWNYNTTPATRIDNQDALNAYASFTGYCWRKYIDLQDKDNIRLSTLHVSLIRYAEVLLTYAEARIEANQIDASVYAAINAVRQRPSVDMPAITTGKTQEELRSIIRRERLYELAGEGFRLFDIHRWKIAEQVMNGPLYGRIPTGLLATAPVIDANGIAHYDDVPNKSDMRVVETRSFDPKRDYLWPIPYIETQTDPAITQNPGY
ncbi:RagB/SusD family nutrient uptake outer membrane protein [Compostibacter hankyongensis]|uniref:RagB/SusD family nutrient uptake outer membrane protein n=1 Tax=Compostibacter hankyongensis TaxID=1007089 RepID=A0ABP8FVF5_9BACT